jgi:hypothetical protein
MKSTRENAQRAGKTGERTGSRCPICDEPILRQESITRNGTSLGHKLVCSKRGCPWQKSDR